MNIINAAVKALACGMGALAITAVMGWSFVTSTATNPELGFTPTAQVASYTMKDRHLWFGQSRPAVLVD